MIVNLKCKNVIILWLFALFCSLSFGQLSKFSVSGGAVAEQKNIDQIQVTYPAGKGWPQIRFAVPDQKWGRGVASISIRQLKPQKRLRFRITAGSWTPQNALKGGHIQNELQFDEATNFVFSHQGNEKPRYFMIAAGNPTEEVVLEISNLEFAETSTMTKKRLPPLPPVIFKGKPIFPLGAYDHRPVRGKMYEIDPGFLDAGGNFTELGYLAMPFEHYDTHAQPAVFNALEKIKNDKRFDNVAILVGLGFNLLFDDSETGGVWGMNVKNIPARGEALAKRKKALREGAKKLSQYPNVIGYTMDEPENMIWKYYKEHRKERWDKNKDTALSEDILEWIGWTNDIIKEYHPGALRMPLIAWWTTYECLGDLYDVIIANTYISVTPETEEFDADFFRVSYDAAMQVNAARKLGGGRSAIFMPQMYDILRGRRGLTYNEQLYVNFAPITRGVMGIHGWRLQRCTVEYREKVIFPAMKEVSKLSDFFLVEWHDELVSSSHDSASVDYLKRFQERVRLVEGLEDAAVVAVKDAVPDVTYCLRKHPDGRYLLLIANNRKETVEVNFKIGIENKFPVLAKDQLSDEIVTIDEKGDFKDELTKFKIRAYIF